MQDHDDVMPVEPELFQDVLDEAGRTAVWQAALLGGVGSFLAILLIQVMARQLSHPLLLAPFGASCVLLFLAHESEFAQPRNLVLGYAIGAATGFAALWLFPGQWWSVAVAVGLAISLMRITHSVHPPAGAAPIVIVLTAPGWKFLLTALGLGVLLLLFSAWTFNAFVRGRARPVRRR